MGFLFREADRALARETSKRILGSHEARRRTKKGDGITRGQGYFTKGP